MKSGQGNLTFTTDSVLIISAGEISGRVQATCTIAGTIANLPAYSINSLTQPLAYLQSVTNETDATGGLDEETLDEVKVRAFAAIRRRGLVSADDYEQESLSILGLGAVVKAIGNLAADLISFRRGVVHLFCLNPDGSLLNEAQRSQLQTALQAKTHISVNVYASNVDVFQVDVFAIVSMIPGANPEAIAYDIWLAIQEYLKPGYLPLGETVLIKEIEYLIRGITGVDFVQSVTIGEYMRSRYSTNIALPHPYSAAKIMGMGIDIVDGTNTYNTAWGIGDPD